MGEVNAKLRVKDFEESLGLDHPDTVAALRDLGEGSLEIGDYSQAERTLAEVIKRKRRTNGKQIDAFEIIVRQKYGFVLVKLGKYQEAREIEEPLLHMAVDGYGAGGTNTLFVWRNLSSILLKLGDSARFFAIGDEILPAQIGRPIGLSSDEIVALYIVGRCYKRAGDAATASRIFRRIIRQCIGSRRCTVILFRSLMIVAIQIPIVRVLARTGLFKGEGSVKIIGDLSGDVGDV